MKAGKKMKKATVLKGVTASFLALAMVVSAPLGTSASAAWMESVDPTHNGMFSNPYTSLEDALQAAREKHEEVVDEGTTLLKNDGLLPMRAKSTHVTVFNSSAELTEALEGVGFAVNAVSTQTSTTLGQEGGAGNKGVISSVNPSQAKAMKEYGDAAIVRIFRTAGEANDVSTGRSLTGNSPLDRQWGDITWVDSETGEIVEWTKAAYDQGKLVEAWPDGTVKGWNHEHLTPNEPLAIYGTNKELASRDTEPVRHGLMLTKMEEEMIQLAKANFENVIVVFDSITQFELWDLEHDDQINAIIASGRMTNTSLNNPAAFAARGVARVISGETNPSSYLVSQWDRDMTADPTWQNFGDNFQTDSSTQYYYSDGTPTGSHTRASIGGGTGLHGVDYEEGIYLGYKYYETYWYESIQGKTELTKDITDATERKAKADEWHEAHVTYPFGYGLTYADFKYEIVGAETVKGAKKEAIEAGATLQGSLFASTEAKAAEVKTINLKVKITNTDSYYGGKAVAQVYVSAPYIDNGVEKPYVKLVGFEKSRYLNPGQSEVVTVPVQVQDVASFDYDGKADTATEGYTGYILDEGKYTFHAMNSSSVLRSEKLGCYDSVDVTIENGGKAVELTQDDYSGNKVESIFSTPNTRAYTVRDTNIMAAGGTGMTILSRHDLDGTFPKHPELTDLKLDDNYIDDFVRSEYGFIAGGTRPRSETGLTTAKADYTAPANADAWYYDSDKGDYDYRDSESDPWYMTQAQFDAVSANWTQAKQSVRDNDTTGAGATVKLREMSGTPLYNADGTINSKWDNFMNQLTYLELQIIASCGNSALARIDAIEKNQSAARDNTSVINNIYHWGDQPLLSRTWNLKLCADHGRLTAYYAALGGNSPTGWWSPGCNLQRTPFSGRNGDYYGQDALQAGLIISAVTNAAQENGLACWIKHFVLNDQETNRNAAGLFTWGDEQTFRENYFLYPQKAFQEGRAQGNMQSFARIGGQLFSYSYEANTKLIRHQWGWTGTSVTDMLMGSKVVSYTVPETAANWMDANAAGGKDVKLDQTKNWIGGATVSYDQLVRGAQGVPDGTNSKTSIFSNGKYVNTINNLDAATQTVINKTDIGQITNNPTSGVWSESMRSGKGGVYLPNESQTAPAAMTTSGYHQWYYTRMTAMYACYEAATSRGNQNGMLVNDNTSQLRNYHNSSMEITGLTQLEEVDELTVAITDQTSFVYDTGVEGDYGSYTVTKNKDGKFVFANKVEYEVVEGALPTGLSLNSNNGNIVGTPMNATNEDIVVTVQCRVANYLYGNKTVIIKPIAPAIALSTVSGTVGSAFSATIDSSAVVGDNKVITVNGLPAGLTYADGTVSGTPLYAGTYDVEIAVSVTVTIGSGRNERKEVRTYRAPYTLQVAAKEGLTEAKVQELIDAATSGKLTEAQAKTLIDAATGDKITEAQAKALISAATTGGLTEAQVKTLIDAATGDKLTEQEVQALIDASLKNSEGGCGSSVESTLAIVTLATVALGAAVVTLAKKAKKKD